MVSKKNYRKKKNNPKTVEVRLAGFGGQGIILAGYILGKASSLYDNKNSAFTQSYGPEARGGACSADVVISEESVDYPKVIEPDILVVMGQEAYKKYISLLKKNGVFIYDSDLVSPSRDISGKFQSYGIPATRIAEEKIGKRIVANIVMLGAFAGITDVVKKDALEDSIKTSVKRDFVNMNIKAFDEGFKFVKGIVDNED